MKNGVIILLALLFSSCCTPDFMSKDACVKSDFLGPNWLMPLAPTSYYQPGDLFGVSSRWSLFENCVTYL